MKLLAVRKRFTHDLREVNFIQPVYKDNRNGRFTKAPFRLTEEQIISLLIGLIIVIMAFNFGVIVGDNFIVSPLP